MAPSLRSLPPTKKRKLDTTPKLSSKATEIKRLEDELATASSLNSLADLVNLVVLETADAQDVSKGIYALYRTFVVIISSGKMSGGGGDEAAKKVKAWLWERLHAYTDYLVGLLKDDEKHLRTSALQILFSLQKHLSTASSSPSNPQFHVSHFKKIVTGLLLCPPSTRSSSSSSNTPSPSTTVIDPDVLEMFYETWFSVHDDVRWFFLREAASVVSKGTNQAAKNLLFILEKLDTFPTDKTELNSWWVAELGKKPPKPKAVLRDGEEEDKALLEKGDENENEEEEEEDDWRKFFEDEPAVEEGKSKTARLHQMTVHQSLHSLASHKAVFTRAWLALLPRLSAQPKADSGKLAVRALNLMHRGVLPHLTRPILVMDWIAGCVDMGGAVGLLALNGLFVLMREYNLDYPSFYTRLYAFLDRDVLHSKHRARFFRMTELFLNSTHLPATLLASFVKRLARLSLNAPPAAIVMIVPFTYNVLKKHPALMPMIHREVDGVFEDPFLPTAPNPLSTHALESSLWELYSHRTHYHATVSTLTKIFAEAFTKPNYAMEDFLDHTYATLFDTDAKRKIKKEPPLSMESDRKFDLFPTAAAEAEKKKDGEGMDVDVPTGDLVSELWVF